MRKILNLFEIVNMGISACEICPKMIFWSPEPTLGPTNLIIVDQIQVKLVSPQTYLGKEKKYWSGQFDNFSTPPQV